MKKTNMGHVGKHQAVNLSLCLDSREVHVGGINLEYIYMVYKFGIRMLRIELE